jgi:hypothetical protein
MKFLFTSDTTQQRRLLYYFCIVLNIYFCTLFSGKAQMRPPDAPQNIQCITSDGKIISANIRYMFIPVSFDVLFDSVQGANTYLLDIAEDSIFTRFLPGLRNYSARLPLNDCYKPQGVPPFSFSCNSTPKRGAIRVTNLLQGRQYYARIKAVNQFGESSFSSTATVRTNWSGAYPLGFSYTDLRERYLSVLLRNLTDTSVTFSFYGKDDSRVQGVIQNSKDTANSKDGVLTVRGLRTGTTNIVTIGAIPSGFCCFYDTLYYFNYILTILHRINNA